MDIHEIVIVDDHVILTEGLVQMIEKKPSLRVSHTFNNCKDALSHCLASPPEILITDHTLGDGTGIELTRTLLEVHPHLKIIMLSMHDEAALVQQALDAGIGAYVLKTNSYDELIDAIYSTLAGEIFISKSLVSPLLMQNKKAGQTQLSPRELEILKLIVAEKSTREIAEALFLSDRTVETHRKNILRKTGTSNAVGLVKFAIREGLIPAKG